MATVSIHAPKTPVTKGSSGMAKATIPNICKMPGPPAPFVPSPLPNIAKSGNSPKDYSTSVQIEGNAVAIRGATFESMGDVASKATGGGLISANTHGPAKFITPGSMTVKIEGKSVHLLGEPMLNNCGPSGSPPNTGATMLGLDQAKQSKSTPPPKPKGCQCKKGTSAKNRKNVNKSKDGKKPRCSICNKTAAESAALKVREKEGLLQSATDPAEIKKLKESIKNWKKRKNLEADHKFPSSKIKQLPDFKKLETKDLDAARKIMHDQSNMRGLCKSCNGSLQAASKFEGADIIAKIKAAL